MADQSEENSGVAYLKQDYIIPKNEDENGEPPSKKVKVDGEPASKRSKADGETKLKPKGQFKNRYNKNKLKVSISEILCPTLINLKVGAERPQTCNLNQCRYLHDIEEYLKNRPPDIDKECYVFKTQGFCPRGVTCRFGKEHITADGYNIVNEECKGQFENNGLKTLNLISKETAIKVRRKNYDFSKSETILEKLPSAQKRSDEIGQPDVILLEEDTKIGPCPNEDIFKLKAAEKRRIDWSNKLYLSPLTTLGNLPFRRVCKEFGADITCGEMAMATSILQCNAYEHALLKRHESEDLFGVQLCGNNPYAMTKCAQFLEETVNIDFIDVNLGCPIDLVYQKGGGSGLLRREKVLESVVRSMSEVMNLPLTIKTRTGVYADKNVAHKLIPMFNQAGVSLITVHGRSREQRYTKTPDWNYINECAKIAAPTPVFGNGDILSYHDYNTTRTKYSNLSGVMIGRGALYKPWIFQEIKEQKDWDISSSERLEIIKKFVRYGLSHWGSDNKGVETTRKFTLEWLSFLHRYIPVGVLERPQKINQRPPRYIGRDDLETLMASSNCADWVKITEMLLGPVPDNFVFFPKHKANSWSTE